MDARAKKEGLLRLDIAFSTESSSILTTLSVFVLYYRLQQFMSKFLKI